ncbi:MAG: AAA family ATPase [Leptospiraceae bacterium]|nr:AAA family ATPase [Leptospiraceae bacterium]
MKTIQEFLDKIKNNINFTYKFEHRYPYIYLSIISKEFKNLEDENECEILFSKWINLAPSDINSITSNNLITVTYTNEKIEEVNRGDHWLARQLNLPIADDRVLLSNSENLKIVHFYGYKGGQGRSSVLASISRILADEGWRVLIIDSDLEAPTLDKILDAQVSNLEGTLLGYHLGIKTNPINCYKSIQYKRKGMIDLIPCYPSRDEEKWKSEYIAFLLKASMDSNVIYDVAKQITPFAKDYDAIFIDHRTGLSNTPIFWVNYFRGPFAITVRLDEQWESAKKFFSQLFSYNKEFPGLYIYQVPNNSESFFENKEPQMFALKDLLAKVIGENEDPDSLESNILSWPYDKIFHSTLFPAKSQMTQDLKDAINEIRNTLELKKEIDKEDIITQTSDESGNKSRSSLIHIPILLQLFDPDNKIIGIFGRKGTGKTRLYKELVLSTNAEPLFSSNDFENGGAINSSITGGYKITNAIQKFTGNKSAFWWSIILTGLMFPDTKKINGQEFHQVWFEKVLSHSLNEDDLISQIEVILKKNNKKRIFLIDGIETAFDDPRLLKEYVYSLFKNILEPIHNSPQFKNYLTIKIFLRTDLIPNSIQNIEQLLGKERVKYLQWNNKYIFNFVITLIAENEWFKSEKAFADKIEKYSESIKKIKEGKEFLEIEECEKFLALIFPKKIEKAKSYLMNFFKNYFSDNSFKEKIKDENDSSLTYNPRVFEFFISSISESGKNNSQKIIENIGVRRQLSQDIVWNSYQSASGKFFDNVKQEIVSMIQFSTESEENTDLVGEFLNNFSGLATPFKKNELKKELFKKMKNQGLSNDQIEEALDSMLDFGIFEKMPTDPNRWRVGRLFKESLGMKFSRKEKE